MTALEPPHVRVARIFRDRAPVGATKTRLLELVLALDSGPRGGRPMGRSTFYAAWAELERRGWIVQDLDLNARTTRWFPHPNLRLDKLA